MHVACRRDSDRCFCWFLAAMLMPMLMGTNMVSLYKALKFGKVILFFSILFWNVINHTCTHPKEISITYSYVIVINLQLTGDDLYFHNECQGSQSLTPVCSLPMRNAVERGGGGNFHKKIYCLLSRMCWHLVI